MIYKYAKEYCNMKTNKIILKGTQIVSVCVEVKFYKDKKDVVVDVHL